MADGLKAAAPQAHPVRIRQQERVGGGERRHQVALVVDPAAKIQPVGDAEVLRQREEGGAVVRLVPEEIAAHEQPRLHALAMQRGERAQQKVGPFAGVEHAKEADDEIGAARALAAQFYAFGGGAGGVDAGGHDVGADGDDRRRRLLRPADEPGGEERLALARRDEDETVGGDEIGDQRGEAQRVERGPFVHRHRNATPARQRARGEQSGAGHDAVAPALDRQLKMRDRAGVEGGGDAAHEGDGPRGVDRLDPHEAGAPGVDRLGETTRIIHHRAGDGRVRAEHDDASGHADPLVTSVWRQSLSPP